MIIKAHVKTVLLLSVFLNGTVEAALVDGVTLQFDASTTSGLDQPTSGSWWGSEISNSVTLYTPLVAHDGIVLGTTQLATGSHFGAPDGTENLTITEAWQISGATGMHHSTSPITIISASGNNATLDFSGLSIAWNGIEDISLGGDIANFPDELGIATIICGIDCGIGDTFALDYAAHEIPEIGGQYHTIHLEGTIVQTVPIPPALWLFASGLMLMVRTVKRRQDI